MRSGAWGRINRENPFSSELTHSHDFWGLRPAASQVWWMEGGWPARDRDNLPKCCLWSVSGPLERGESLQRRTAQGPLLFSNGSNESRFLGFAL